jgi:hypothetical protein
MARYHFHVRCQYFGLRTCNILAHTINDPAQSDYLGLIGSIALEKNSAWINARCVTVTFNVYLLFIFIVLYLMLTHMYI